MEMNFVKEVGSTQNTASIKKSKKKTLMFKVDKSVKKASIELFIKSLVTDVRELNLLKNDISFFMNESYPQLNSSTQDDCKFKDGTIFFCWVALNKKIFPFDLFYLRKNLLPKEIKKVQKVLKNTDNYVFARKPFFNVNLPFNIEFDE